MSECTCEHHDDGSCVAAGDLLNAYLIIDSLQERLALTAPTKRPGQPAQNGREDDRG